jgi:hypothetical protein
MAGFEATHLVHQRDSDDNFKDLRGGELKLIETALLTDERARSYGWPVE